MAIVSRRALQLMLDDLSGWLSARKAKDIVKRLNNRNVDQAVPQEYELLITWAVSRVADLEIERPLQDREPDIYSTNIIDSGPVYIEVAAISDASLSGENLMQRAANIITQHANSISAKSGRHIALIFNEESGYTRSRRGPFSQYFRRRRITRSFELTDPMKRQLRKWIAREGRGGRLRLIDANIDVLLEWRPNVHPFHKIYCSMPSEAHDLEDNPVYRVPREKAKEQLSYAPPGTARCIVLCDAGCRLLRGASVQSATTVTARQIVEHFLRKYTNFLVCILSPRPVQNIFSSTSAGLMWKIDVYDARDNINSNEHDKLYSMIEHLPRPIYEGYQIRKPYQKGVFLPQSKGQYLSPKIVTKDKKTCLYMSARALQELLAGRMTHEEFKDLTMGDDVEWLLKLGQTINSAKLVFQNVSADDDYLVFEFSEDPAAANIRIPDANL